MESIFQIHINDDIIEITPLTPFILILAEYLYEDDFDLMIEDLKKNTFFVNIAQEVKKLKEKYPSITSRFIVEPFIFGEFLDYLREFNIRLSDFNHISLNGLFDYILECTNKKSYDEVKEIIEFMLKIDPNFAPAYEILGSVLVEEGHMAQGKHYLEMAVKLDPWNIAAFSELGETYFNLGEFDKAAEIWLKEIELSPNNYVTYFMIADAYMEYKNYNAAADILEKFLGRFPKSILGKYELANIYEILLRKDEAIIMKKEILESYPEYTSDIEIWSKIMYENKKFDQVEDYILKYLVQNPESDHFKLLLFIPYLRKGLKKEALDLFNYIKKKYPWYIYGMKDILIQNTTESEQSEMDF